MSTFFNDYVLRICDRLFDSRNPESIQRQGQLRQFLVLVLIFHMIMGITFIKMEDYERKHPRVIRDVDISFLCSTPPVMKVLNSYEAPAVPSNLNLTPGSNPDISGSEAQARKESQKVTAPLPDADLKESILPAQSASPITASRFTTEAPPVALTSMNPTKLSPESISRPRTEASGARNAGLPENDESKTGEGIGGEGSGFDGLGGAAAGPGTSSDEIPIGSEQEPISTAIQERRALANIGIYKKQLIKLIGNSWQPGKKGVSLTVRLTVAKQGELLASELICSSGSRKLDREALKTIESLDLPALPDWFRGEDLTFQLDLNSI